MKKIYTLIVMVLVAVGAMAQDEVSVWNGKCTMWTRGEGTQESPILIESAENLAFLSYICAYGFETEGLYFELTTDIDLNGSETMPWNPIGTQSYYDYQSGCLISNISYNYFRGHFNGGEHSIFNLYSESGGGLFGVVSGMNGNRAVVSDVKVMSGLASGGGIAQKLVKATASRCVNKADVVNENGRVGGIAAEVSQSSVVKECFNEGNVNGKVAGGLGGFVTSSTIVNCYNVGEVEGAEIAGGCVGQSNAIELKNSYNVGTVACASANIGGLIGKPANADVVSNAYYLNTCGASGVGTSKTEDEMCDRAFVGVLNNETDVWGFDDAFENQGFPILKSNPTEVGEISENGLFIYPNPANDVLVVECEGATGIAVYDVIGQCVLEMAATNASTRLDVSSLESGVYLLSVSGNNRPALVTRFVVTR